MGQTFINVAYGVVVTPEIDRAFREDPNDEDSDLIWLSQEPGFKDIDTGEGFDVLAFCFLSGGYAEGDEIEIEDALMLSDIPIRFPNHLETAKEKWRRFAVWTQKERGFTLPDAGLMLVRVERA